jgi:hypothetical protein
MEDLVVIEEMLAMKMIDAGMDFVQVKYAVPKKIAELFKISSVQQQQPVVVEKTKNRKRGLPVYIFKVSKLARQRMNRLMLGSSNYAAAKIIIENFDANEVVTKAELQKKWEELGMSKKFIVYGSGAMMKAGILTSVDEVSK